MVDAALVGLSHRRDPRVLPVVLRFVSADEAEIRFSCTVALNCYEDERAIAALVSLCQDPERDVRNWAAFGLGSQIDADTPALREALIPLLEDEDPEVRGEAMIGLARRGDTRVAPFILRELQGPFYGDWAPEAATLLPSPEYLNPLLHLRDQLRPDHYFQRSFQDAITACSSLGKASH